MPNSVTKLMLAALLSFGTVASAQETAPAAESELSLGEPVDENGNQLGTTYDRESKGDWVIRCLRTDQEIDPCEMNQMLTDGEGNEVAEVSMFKLPEGGQAVAGATVVTPLETLLTEQLRISVDGSTPKRYPFRFCTQIGCFAQIGFTAADVDAFKRGAMATITIVPRVAPEQTVDLELSLSGFTDAINTIPAR